MKQNGKEQSSMSATQFLKTKMRSLKIGKCYLTEELFEIGEGYVVVTREFGNGKISMASYMVDMFCVGVKDALYFLRLSPMEFENIMAKYSIGCHFYECTYAEAHSLVYGAVAFASEAGIEPAPDFNLAKYVLEEDTGKFPHTKYEYGRNGKHFLIAKNDIEASRYLPQLRAKYGDDYHYEVLDGSF